MTSERQQDSKLRNPMSATFLPPATIGETAWDILLDLHGDRCRSLGLVKLAHLVSVPQPALHRWLELLEERKLIAGVWDMSLGESRPLLTAAGRQLLDRYLSATSDLQVVAHD